jgi:hypothetical protein
METDAHFDTLIISFGVPSKVAFPPDSPHRAPSERDAPSLEHSFIHLSKSPVYKPLSGSPHVLVKITGINIIYNVSETIVIINLLVKLVKNRIFLSCN